MRIVRSRWRPLICFAAAPLHQIQIERKQLVSCIRFGQCLHTPQITDPDVTHVWRILESVVGMNVSAIEHSLHHVTPQGRM